MHNPNEVVGRLSKTFGKFMGGYNYKRFIVLSHARTGSNMLIDMLNSHPHIYAEREIFRELNGRETTQILDKIYGPYTPNICCVGFKIFYYHPMDDVSKVIWDILAKMDNLYIIHLKRENIIRILVSLKIAELTDIWRLHEKREAISINKKKIRFDIDDLNSKFTEISNYEEGFTKKFEQHPMISVTYENLVTQPQAEFVKILNLLKLDNYKPKTRSVRQNPEKLSELIENYSELEAYFKETRWSNFFTG